MHPFRIRHIIFIHSIALGSSPPSAAIGADVVLLGAVASVKADAEDNVTTAAANRRFWAANCGEAKPTGGDW